MSEDVGEKSAQSLEEDKSKMVDSTNNVESKSKLISKSESANVENIEMSGSRSGENISKSNQSITENENVEEDSEEGDRVNDLADLTSYIKMLDKPREIQAPIDITLDYLKQISEELGLIKLCWPVLSDVSFENRTNFPESYLKNSNKEKLLLLYAENFRRQFCHQHPDRKPLFLACDNECGMQKMVCTTIRPTTLPHSEMATWKNCSRFVGDHVRYEPLEEPTLIPRHLYSPHTTFLRQSGQSFEIATALCSLLIGLGYDAYVVSGYAIKDVTMKIMCRVDCPIPPIIDEVHVPPPEQEDQKYKITPAKNLQSKFLAMMKQRELDAIKAEEQKQAEIERQLIMEEEKRPFDELEGQRVHAWVLLAAGTHRVKETIFIEPSTGISHSLDTDIYCGIESVWNNENYWVNLQNCSKGLGSLCYDFNQIKMWEHLLLGEPINWRQQKVAEIGEEDETIQDFWDEKHLDIPYPWSMKISISHEVLERRFPDGSKTTQYKRTLVEEYAPYICEDGLVQKIVRFTDFACTEMESVDEKFENRHDKLQRSFLDAKINRVTEYFGSGREDSVMKHIYYKNDDCPEAERTIFFNSKARFDGLSKIEILDTVLTEHYCDREDKLYYRQVVYDSKRVTNEDSGDGLNRRPILKIIQRFLRNEEKSPYDDISVREFNMKNREIHLKYHYGKDNVTASTRTFLKPPISEMGNGMTFRSELTYGYQAQIGAKPPRQLQMFLLLEQQIKDEKGVIDSIRDFENQISEFLLLRAHEMAFSKLDVSMYNREQNLEYRTGMLEQEEKQRMYKEKEVEEEIDYLSPYLARLGNPISLSYAQCLDVKYACLDEFKQLLIGRANDIQYKFDSMSAKVEELQTWYTQNHENLTPEEEAKYFEEVNDLIFYLRTLEIRLSRHKELTYLRYEAMLEYVNSHPMLDPLQFN